MRFYIKRLKNFQAIKNMFNKYDSDKAMAKAYDYFKNFVAERMISEAKKASSFRVYILPKHKPLSFRGETYVVNFKKYFDNNAERYMGLVRYYENAYRQALKAKSIHASTFYKKHGFYPYSRKNPQPPIPPEFINIQSGELVNSYAYDLRLASNNKSIIFKMRNESLHFFFMVDSVKNDRYRMMERPIVDYIASRFYKKYKDELPRINSLFSPINYVR